MGDVLGVVGLGAAPLAVGLLGGGELMAVRITFPEIILGESLRVHPVERFNQQRLVTGEKVQRSQFVFLKQRLQQFW
jgi:hypothetical protein